MDYFGEVENNGSLLVMERTKFSKEQSCSMHSIHDIHFLQCQFVKLRVSCDEYLSVHWSIMSHWKGFQQSLETSSDLIWTLEPPDFAEKSQNVESLCAFQASMSLYICRLFRCLRNGQTSTTEDDVSLHVENVHSNIFKLLICIYEHTHKKNHKLN